MKQTAMKACKFMGQWSAIAALSALSFSPRAIAQAQRAQAQSTQFHTAQALTDQLQSTPPSSGPSFAQLGSTQAYVPMKQESFMVSGNEWNRHILATTSGNLDMRAQVEMKCPAGSTVNYLAYIPQGQNLKLLVNSDTNQQTYTRTVTFQPFSLEDFESVGQELLGGVWHSSNGHPPLRSATVRKTLKKNVQARGRCTGWANSQTKSFPVTLTVTFEDTDFPPPPEG
ncbi:MAG: hypothetical protein AAFU53_12640 [Cyanobacteria bacterium J06632_3]